MRPHPKIFKRKDLLHSWIDKKKNERAHQYLRIYYSKVYDAFRGAYQIDLDQKPVELQQSEKDLDILHYFFLDVFKSRNSFSSPFDGVLEAPDSISDLYQTYGTKLSELRDASDALHENLMLELMEKIWGITDAYTVTQSDLDQHGYPTGPEPDLMDYW